MTTQKPKDIIAYKKWLKEIHNVEISRRTEQYYVSSINRVKNDLENSDYWKELTINFKEYHDGYVVKSRGYDLFQSREFIPTILTKPFESFFQKTFRKNIVENKNWPAAPTDGWVLPDNWLCRINDALRTSVTVKYLDGIDYMVDKIGGYTNSKGLSLRTYYEARDEGYYAVHLYIPLEFELPKMNWDTEKINISLEIQITTQLKEVIRKLLHSYYEEKRIGVKRDDKWQWNYNSDEFTANYLGHILHYLEGMIMEVREKEKNRTRMP